MFDPTLAHLDRLDDAIRHGHDVTAFFERLIITHHAPLTCRSCGCQVDALVLDGGDGYPGMPGLLEKKRSFFTPLPCPSCRQSLTSYVVALLERT